MIWHPYPGSTPGAQGAWQLWTCPEPDCALTKPCRLTLLVVASSSIPEGHSLLQELLDSTSWRDIRYHHRAIWGLAVGQHLHVSLLNNLQPHLTC